MNAKLEPRKDPKVLAIEAKLKEPISINMDKQPLSEAVTFLQNYTGLNIVLDPKGLADEGLTSASPVSLVVNNIQLKTALKLMLQPARADLQGRGRGGPDHQPAGEPRRDTYVKTYYVGDLVMPPDRGPQDADARQISCNVERHGVGHRRRMLGQGFAIGGSSGRRPADPAGFGHAAVDATGERPMVDMTPIIQLITTSIAPGTWQVQDGYGHDVSPAYGLGGGFGGDAGRHRSAAAARCDRAVLPQHQPDHQHTAEVHDQVADLLRQLRRLQDLQVSIEVRFITVNDTFFEQIGVDFDFQIQSDSVGKHSTFAASPTRQRRSSRSRVSRPARSREHVDQHQRRLRHQHQRQLAAARTGGTTGGTTRRRLPAAVPPAGSGGASGGSSGGATAGSGGATAGSTAARPAAWSRSPSTSSTRSATTPWQ